MPHIFACIHRVFYPNTATLSASQAFTKSILQEVHITTHVPDISQCLAQPRLYFQRLLRVQIDVCRLVCNFEQQFRGLLHAAGLQAIAPLERDADRIVCEVRLKA